MAHRPPHRAPRGQGQQNARPGKDAIKREAKTIAPRSVHWPGHFCDLRERHEDVRAIHDLLDVDIFVAKIQIKIFLHKINKINFIVVRFVLSYDDQLFLPSVVVSVSV